MKLIKSATLYKIDLPTADLVAQHLEERKFTQVASFASKSEGFAPIEETGEMLTEFTGGFAFGFRIDTKVVPPSAVDIALKERLAKIEQDSGYKPGRKHRRQLKEEIITELSAKALVKTTTLTVFYDRESQILVVPTTSKAVADTVTSAMIHAIGSIKAATIYVSSAKHGLTERLNRFIHDDDETAFGEFEPVDKVVLKRTHESVSINTDNIDTAFDGIAEAMLKGFTVDAIRLYHHGEGEGGMSFLLGHDFRMRSIDFGDKPIADDPSEPQDSIEKWQHEASVQMLQVVRAVNHLCDLLGYQPPAED